MPAGERHDPGQSPRLAIQARPAHRGRAGIARHAGVVDVDPDHVHHAVPGVIAGEGNVPVAGVDVPVEQEAGTRHRAHRPHDPGPVSGPVTVPGGIVSQRVVIPGAVHLVTEPDHRVAHAGRHQAGGQLPRVPVVGPGSSEFPPVRRDVVGNHLLRQDQPAVRRIGAEPPSPVGVTRRRLGEPGPGPLGPRRVRVVVQQRAVHRLPRLPGEAGQGADASAGVQAGGLGIEGAREQEEGNGPAGAGQERRRGQPADGRPRGAPGPRAAMPRGRAGRRLRPASRRHGPGQRGPQCHPHRRMPRCRRRAVRPASRPAK